MKGSVAIVGAGVLGRVLALNLHARDWAVTLWDRDDALGSHSCSRAAAGMLTPYCELETADEVICRLGEASLTLWPRFLSSLNAPVYFRRNGSLCVAHPSDRPYLDRLKDRASRVRPSALSELSGDSLSKLEPELDSRFRHSLYFEAEGHLDPRDLMSATTETFLQKAIPCFFNEEVIRIEPGKIVSQKRSAKFDWVVDTRGLGAKTDLRGIL